MLIREEAAVLTDILRSQRIQARIVGGFTAPSFYVYSLEIGRAEKLSRIQAILDSAQSTLYTWRSRRGLVDVNDPTQRVVVRFSPQPPVLEVSRPKPDRLAFGAMSLSGLQPFEALAGVAFLTKRGQPVIWRMTDPGQPHVLIAGTSGSGKSTLLLSLLLSLCHGTDPANLSVFIVDGGNSSLMIARRLYHVAEVVGDAEGALRLVHQVADLVHQRKATGGIDPTHRVVIVVDELANLLAVMSKAQAQTMHQHLATVAAEGRKFGVHLVAATQKPLAEVTGSLIKSNLAVRFVGAVASWQDAQTATDLPGTGAERLAGRGDFIVRSGMSVRRFQVPFIDGEIAAIRAINRRWPSAADADLHASVLHQCTGAPVQEFSSVAAAPACEDAPRTGAPVHLPLSRSRPPTPAEAAVLRSLYAEHGSKNKTLAAAYGTKTPLLLAYLDQALAVN